MVRNSRFLLKNEVLNKLFYLFFVVVGKKNTKKEFYDTIYDLLSPAERLMIAKRIAIIYLLMKRIDYRSIGNSLKVSQATISKFNLLFEKSQGLKPSFKKILTNEKIFDFLEDLFITLYGPGTPGVNWSAAWKHKLEFEKRKQQGF